MKITIEVTKEEAQELVDEIVQKSFRRCINKKVKQELEKQAQRQSEFEKFGYSFSWLQDDAGKTTAIQEHEKKTSEEGVGTDFVGTV